MSRYRIKLSVQTKKIWLVVLGLVLLAGCTFTDRYALAPEHDTFALYVAQTIGQTFVCHHAGLASVDATELATQIELRGSRVANSVKDYVRKVAPLRKTHRRRHVDRVDIVAMASAGADDPGHSQPANRITR